MIRGDRLGLLQGVRVAASVAAMVAMATVDSLDASDWDAVPTLSAWLLATLTAEVARRVGRLRSVAVPLAMLVVDGVVLGVAVAQTGAHRSPLLGLVYLHVVAVSLLVSHRVALRIAVWHGVLLFAVYVSARARSFGLELPAGESATDAAQLAAAHATGFLLVAVGVAACSAINEQVLRRRQRELSAIAEVGAALSGTLHVDGALLLAVEAVSAALGVDASIAVTDGAGWTAASSRAGTTVLLAGVDAAVGGAVANVGRTACWRSLASTPLDVLAPGATNVVAVPLEVAAERGVLLLAMDGGRRARVALTTVTTAGNIARLVATTVENARLHARVEHLATRDGLTGLVNRRVFDEALDAEVRRARRRGEPLSLAVLDVDHFKAVNDLHGHRAGDEVLRLVAAALAGAARDVDVVARYGGEEFAVLLPGCRLADARDVADKLRRAAVRRGGEVTVTVSAGVATFPDCAADGASLVEAADGALYEAKHGGRDQTRCAAGSRAAVLAVH